jgi:hypothetical protein
LLNEILYGLCLSFFGHFKLLYETLQQFLRGFEFLE